MLKGYILPLSNGHAFSVTFSVCWGSSACLGCGCPTNGAPLLQVDHPGLSISNLSRMVACSCSIKADSTTSRALRLSCGSNAAIALWKYAQRRRSWAASERLSPTPSLPCSEFRLQFSEVFVSFKQMGRQCNSWRTGVKHSISWSFYVVCKGSPTWSALL